MFTIYGTWIVQIGVDYGDKIVRIVIRNGYGSTCISTGVNTYFKER